MQPGTVLNIGKAFGYANRVAFLSAALAMLFIPPVGAILAIVGLVFLVGEYSALWIAGKMEGPNAKIRPALHIFPWEDGYQPSY